MPFYEYCCRACGHTFDRMRPMSQRMNAPECPACAAHQTVLRMSTPAMVGARSADAGPCGQPTGTCCGGACHTH